MADKIKNVALVGASGVLGSKTLQAILQRNVQTLTVITRTSSTDNYPASVIVRKGEYTDAAFLESALQDQDVLVCMLGFAGLPNQRNIFEAAAKAGVKYVLPADYGAGCDNEKTLEAIPMIKLKIAEHDFVESLGMKWICVVTGGWTDYSVQYGAFDIQIPEKRATLYTDCAPFATATIAQVARAVASLLTLPKSTIDKTFANRHLYVYSFVLTQPQVFEAVLRVTETKEEDWQIERKKVQDLIDEGHDMVNKGDVSGHFKIIYGVTYAEGMDGDFSHLAHNKMLGLDESEDLDDVVRAAVEGATPGGFGARAATLKLSKKVF